MLITIATIVQFGAFGQSAPDQQLIPAYVLKGKSTAELRLTRNEIFARYGYIFESSDLKAHFSEKPWYKPSKTTVEKELTAIDKANIEHIREFEHKALSGLSDPSYANKSNAYFRIFYDPETDRSIQKTREVTFHSHCEYGMIRKVVERTHLGGEFVPTAIYAETSWPGKPHWEATRYFNDLKFKCSYYQAINYGCCGSEDYGELYNYQSNEPFLTFHKEFFTVDVPNSKIQLFLGYDHRAEAQDGLNIATLYLSTLGHVVSSVTFIASNEEDKKDIIGYFTPKIELRTHNDQNKILSDGKEIRLWGSNFAKTLADVNGFSVFVEFEGDGTGRKATYDIPIIKGRLYGKTTQNTEVILSLK